jgi:hypothetical protein
VKLRTLSRTLLLSKTVCWANLLSKLLSKTHRSLSLFGLECSMNVEQKTPLVGPPSPCTPFPPYIPPGVYYANAPYTLHAHARVRTCARGAAADSRRSCLTQRNSAGRSMRHAG